MSEFYEAVKARAGWGDGGYYTVIGIKRKNEERKTEEKNKKGQSVTRASIQKGKREKMQKGRKNL